jgi:N-acyl-L-homoserine lactone synthetase
MKCLLIEASGKWQSFAPLTEQMHRLRARQFLDRRRWRVRVEDGKEIDEFDALVPIYVVVVSGSGQLVGSLRLLRTTGPHMLADLFPETMGPAPVIRDPEVWESSRFCVDTEAARAYGPGGVNLATRLLLLGLFEMAETRGLRGIVSVFDLAMERILVRAGCHFERLGPEIILGRGLRTVAALFPVGADVSDVLRQGLVRRGQCVPA